MLLFYLYFIFLRHISARRGLSGAFLRESLFKRSLQITFWQRIRNLRKISCRPVSRTPPEVPSTSSYGWTKVKLEFRSQCKVLLFSTCIFLIMSLFDLYIISFMLLFYLNFIFLRHISARRGLSGVFLFFVLRKSLF